MRFKRPELPKTEDTKTPSASNAKRSLFKFPNLSRKQWLIASVIGVLIVGSLGWWLIDRTKTKVDATTECVAIMSRPSNDRGTEIQAIKGFDSNSNCLYVLVEHYINISDHKNARLYFDKLNETFDPAVGFSPNLLIQDANKTIENFKLKIEGLEKQAETMLQNNVILGPPV